MMARIQVHYWQRGLSLLELLVALAIMAMALGMLYRASGSSARSAGDLQSYQRAAMLAQSLLAARDAIPEAGWNEAGESAGFAWSVQSSPYGAADPNPSVPRLHEVVIEVAWQERGGGKRIVLQTLRPQRLPMAGGGLR